MEEELRAVKTFQVGCILQLLTCKFNHRQGVIFQKQLSAYLTLCLVVEQPLKIP